jgi:hypothetical protein
MPFQATTDEPKDQVLKRKHALILLGASDL